MGIKDINKTLKEIVPEAFMTVPLRRFRGHAIGIDASLWMFKTASSAMKDVLSKTKNPLESMNSESLVESMIQQFYGFTYKLCQAGVTPVWIFDGETHPAKIATEKRKKIRQTKRITIEEERERLLLMDPLERLKELDSFKKNLLSCICFTRDQKEALKEEIRSLGLPLLTAPFDAEIYAAKLSRAQLLVGVWTTDTDTYASGSLITFTGFSSRSSSEGISVDIVLTSMIYDKLGIQHPELRDFCILHECDFNERIPKLGPMSIRKKMELYDWNLDHFKESEPELDWDRINLEQCREIFDGPEIDVNLKSLKINPLKWTEKLRTKVFQMDLPEDPKTVTLL